ncbi:MAG: ferredoxin [Rhodobacterales bacterium CG2_30_65_12]|nr:MAG: ferredoxin [Rhodobacterales bacterium CG2_30_65_12]
MDYAVEAARQSLALIGAAPDDETGGSVLLLGPSEPGFWPAFTAAPEYTDGWPDPLDRYSKRLIGALAARWGGTPAFPSDGPPFAPFIAWALASGRVWASPVGLLVHDLQGLWLSFRGAVRLPARLNLPPGKNPCDTCAGQPCRSACPAAALTPEGYDVAACHAYLDAPAGADCLTRGCAARRACPVGVQYGRSEDQSRFHMKAFHPT